jgi:acetoin utilization protein AcuB
VYLSFTPLLARELISDDILAIRPDDTAALALNWMDEMKISQLPVVREGVFDGVITEDELLDAPPDTPVSEAYRQRLEQAFVHENSHFYDVLKAVGDYRLEIVPVLDVDKNFIGAISLQSIAANLGTLFAVQETGSILVVEIPPHSYSLAEIGRIVESVGGTVLSFYLSRNDDTDRTRATLRVAINDLTSLTAAFEHFHYHVVESHHAPDTESTYRRNFDALMKYLAV